VPLTTVQLGDSIPLSCLFADNKHFQITLYQQPVSDPVYPGDSMTLQCTVLSETCTGEHSVYWFRAGSGESHPGVIYTPGNRSDECKKSPETPSPTQSCVYSLSENNLSPSHAGTYYCAVATCGEILFGKGTKLDVKGTFNEMGRKVNNELKCLLRYLRIYMELTMQPFKSPSVNSPSNYLIPILLYILFILLLCSPVSLLAYSSSAHLSLQCIIAIL
uniref:Ig-like domain-containing protein n=1 Tax=Oncorhynchus mykiss TaxID=8022 RepID=A0A8C7RHM3_ONCMY